MREAGGGLEARRAELATEDGEPKLACGMAPEVARLRDLKRRQPARQPCSCVMGFPASLARFFGLPATRTVDGH